MEQMPQKLEIHEHFHNLRRFFDIQRLQNFLTLVSASLTLIAIAVKKGITKTFNS